MQKHIAIQVILRQNGHASIGVSFPAVFDGLGLVLLLGRNRFHGILVGGQLIGIGIVPVYARLFRRSAGRAGNVGVDDEPAAVRAVLHVLSRAAHRQPENHEHAGAAIGNALTAPKPDPIEEYAYVPEVRQGQSHSKFKPRTQTQQQLTQLKLRKIRFIDDNRNHAIDGGESSKIIFEIMNEGRNPVYDVVPIVETVGKVKHIGISPTVMIEEILPGEGIRYTATVYAGSKLKDGEVTFRVAVSDENGVICDSQEFTLPTQRAD